MRKLDKFLFLVFFGIAFIPLVSVKAWFRNGQSATPTFINTGTHAKPFSVTLSSSAATVIYTRDDNDREILIQNVSAYTVYIGTNTSITASSGPRIKLLSTFNYVTNNTATLYGITEAASGSGEVIGVVEYDAKDKIN